VQSPTQEFLLSVENRSISPVSDEELGRICGLFVDPMGSAPNQSAKKRVDAKHSPLILNFALQNPKTVSQLSQEQMRIETHIFAFEAFTQLVLRVAVSGTMQQESRQTPPKAD
jgi:hypothetical protein